MQPTAAVPALWSYDGDSLMVVDKKYPLEQQGHASCLCACCEDPMTWKIEGWRGDWMTMQEAAAIWRILITRSENDRSRKCETAPNCRNAVRSRNRRRDEHDRWSSPSRFHSAPGRPVSRSTIQWIEPQGSRTILSSNAASLLV